jgi:hypothetical protein
MVANVTQKNRRLWLLMQACNAKHVGYVRLEVGWVAKHGTVSLTVAYSELYLNAQSVPRSKHIPSLL